MPHLSVRAKLRLALVGLGIIPVILLGSILAWRNHSAQLASAIELQQEVAARVAIRFTTFVVDELESDIRIAARISNVAALLPDQQRSVISRLLSYKAAFVELTMLDATGGVTASVSRRSLSAELPPASWTTMPEYSEPLESQSTYYGAVHFDANSAEPQMHIAVPLVDRRAGTVSGILIAEVSLQEVWDEVALTFIGESGDVFVTEQRGGVVAHQNPSVVLRGTTFGIPAQSGIHAGLNGEQAVVATAPIQLDGHRLYVVAERPTAEALLSANKALRLAIGLIAGTLGVALLAAWVVVAPIIKRVAALRDASREIAEGRSPAMVEARGDDELAELGKAFNRMVYALQERVREALEARRQVAELNEELEEKVRRRTASLERSNQELEQFAYVASHDLQEPLRMVASYTQLLEKRYKDQLDDKARSFIAYAVDGATRMQRLINDLLSYSRVQTRGGEFSSVDLNAVLGNARANLSAAIDDAGALVTNDDLPTVFADAGQLESVLQNLIGNGIKFSQDETPHVHVSAIEHDSEIEVLVEDNGIGIRDDFQERVFVIFQRLHGRKEYDGTGIGLALCKRIVDRHGGRIWFESEEGEGTTFHFTLPIRRADKEGV